jgi:hypothetical protein
MRRNILIPATAIVATALYFWYEERKKRRNQIDSDMASLVMHTRTMVQTPRPQFMEMPPSPLPRRSVTDVIDTRDSPPSTSASTGDSASDSTEAPLLVSQPLICDGRQMAVAVLLIGYLVLISIASSVITLYRLC